MKVKMVCEVSHKAKEVQLPMDQDALLEIQGNILGRDTLGHIEGADVKCFDEEGNEIENVFLLNKHL